MLVKLFCSTGFTRKKVTPPLEIIFPLSGGNYAVIAIASSSNRQLLNPEGSYYKYCYRKVLTKEKNILSHSLRFDEIACEDLRNLFVKLWRWK